MGRTSRTPADLYNGVSQSGQNKKQKGRKAESQNKDRQTQSLHTLTGVKQATTTSSLLVFASHPNDSRKDCDPKAPKHLHTHKASGTTTVIDIVVVSSNHRAPTARKPHGSVDRTQTPHKKHYWHGDPRPTSPTSCRLRSPVTHPKNQDSHTSGSWPKLLQKGC